MRSRAVLAITTGVAGGTLGLLMADTLWALTAPLPTFLRYVAGAAVAIVGGIWIGDTALVLERYLTG